MKITYSNYPFPESPKSKWFIEIEWMSGDGDHYEKVPYSFKTEEEFAKAYNILKDIVGKLYYDKNQTEIKNRLWNELRIDVEWDITSQGMMAQPHSISDMYYYDRNGVKFKINI